MSEVKVNKISPRTNCGTVQLGDSGDTITIPAGATITNNGTAAGFGATGAASWDTTVKTSGFTAVSGVGYFVDTTSGAISVNLPAGTAGAVVAIKDYANTFDTNNLTLVQNGSDKIGGSTNNGILSTEGLSVTLIYVDSTQGWLVTDDGLQSVAVTNPYIEATGGTITECGNCRIHTFTGPGTFSVTKTAVAATDNVVSHLVIAGGAGGGGSPNNQSGGGGGGAGGYREVVSPSSPYTGSPLNGYPNSPNRVTVTATDFPITVGSGGAGGVAVRGVSGSNSVFSTITSAGGGAGGMKTNCEPEKDPLPGGSGGGGTANTGCALPMRLGNQPPTSPAQGNPGGSNNISDSGGGGGGAAAAGFDANTPAPNQGGFGGTGTTSCITGSPVTRAGGGGGGNQLPGNNGTGGPGGGGNGGRNTPGTNGSVNTGSGGGGAGSQGGGCVNGGSGGSGIVVIRYRYQ